MQWLPPIRDVYHNFNQFYMAGLMTAPMIVIELLLMAGMSVQMFCSGTPGISSRYRFGGSRTR